MTTTNRVQIEVTLDSSGVATGARQVQDELGGIGAAASRMGALAAGALAGFSISAFAGKLVSVQREFDVLNSSLITVTGSSAAAAREMAWLKEFAAQTPFGLAQATEAFVRMKSLGLEPTREALTSFGNTASAMGKDMMQFVEAVADATTGQFERLKEFGIKAAQQGQQVSLTFQGVTTTIANNAQAINQYLTDIGNNQFAGAMAERAQTLDGAISALADSWDELFRTISQNGAGSLIYDTVTLAAGAVEELTRLLGLLKTGTDEAKDGAAAMDVVMDGVAAVLRIAATTAATAAHSFEVVGTRLGQLAAQAQALARLDFSGFAEIGRMAAEDVRKLNLEFDKTLKNIWNVGGATKTAAQAFGWQADSIVRLVAGFAKKAAGASNAGAAVAAGSRRSARAADEEARAHQSAMRSIADRMDAERALQLLYAQRGMAALQATQTDKQLAALQLELAGNLSAAARARKEAQQAALQQLQTLELVSAGTRAALEAEQRWQQAQQETAQAAQKQTAGLREQAETLGKTAAEIEALRLAQMQLTLEWEKADDAMPMTAERLALLEKAVAAQKDLAAAAAELDYRRASTEAEKTLRATEKQAQLLQAEAGLIGASAAQRQQVLALRRIEIDLAEKLAEIEANTAYTASQRAALMAQAQAQAAQETANVMAETSIVAWDEVITSMSDAGRDVFRRLATEGTGAFKRIGAALKESVLDLLYQMTVKRWIIQVGASLSGGGSSAGEALSGLFGGGSGGGLGSLFGGGQNLGSMWNMGRQAAGWLGIGSSAAGIYGLTTAGASGLGLAASTGAGMSLAGATGSGLGLSLGGSGLGLAGTAGSAAAASAGASVGAGAGAASAAGGASSLLAGAAAAGPWIAAAIALISIISRMDDSGTPHMGDRSGWSSATGLSRGSVNSDADWGRFGMGWLGGREGVGTATDSLAQSMGQSFQQLLRSFGRDGLVEVFTGWADDSSDDGAWGGLRIALDGQDLVNWNDNRQSRWAPREFADGEEGWTQYVQAVAQSYSRAVVTALQQSDLPQWASRMLGGLASDATVEQINEVLAAIAAMRAAFDGWGQNITGFARLGSDAVDALMRHSGGFEQLSVNMGAYYNAYYSEAERSAHATRQMGETLSRFGAQLPATTADYRALVEQTMAAGEEGTELLAVLLAMSGQFAEVAGAAQAAAEAERERLVGLTGLTAQSMWQGVVDAAASGQGHDAGGMLAMTVLDGIEQAVAANVGQGIMQAVIEQMVTPMVQAAVTGSSISEQVSAAAIGNMVANAQAAAASLNALLSNAEWAAAMAQVGDAVRQIAGSLAGSIPPMRTATARAATSVRGLGNAASRSSGQIDAIRRDWERLIERMADTVRGLRGEVAGTGSEGIAYYQSQLAIATAAARAGDKAAAEQLPGLVKTLSDLVADQNTDRLAVQRQQAALAQGLQETAAVLAQRFGISLPQFASGGMHTGGLRIVGERGPELEMTGPARIISNDRLREMLAGKTADVGNFGLDGLNALRSDLAGGFRALNKTMIAISRRLDEWDMRGLPPERKPLEVTG